MMKKLSQVFLMVLVVSMMCILPNVQKAEAAYPEKPITMIVVNSAGGGVDGLNRAIASRLEKELGVTIVVKNEPGSGGRKGSISLFKSTPDGYTIGMPHFAALLYDKVLAGTELPIDYEKFEVLMRADTTEFFVIVNKDSPYQSIQDFKTAGKPIKFAGSGVGNPSWLQPTALASVMGFEVNFVTGHKNLRESALSLARGDVEASVGSFTHFQGVLDDVRPLVYISGGKSSNLPDVPNIVDAGYPKLAYLGVPWVLAAPPGTPEDILTVLRTALNKIGTSDEFLTWATSRGYNPSSQGPEEFWKSFAEMEQVYTGMKPFMEKK